MSTEIMIPDGCCEFNYGKLIGLIFIPVVPIIDESKMLDTITEDAEFEVIQPLQIKAPNA